MKTKVILIVFGLLILAAPVFAQDCKTEIATVHKQMIDKSSSLPLSDVERLETLIGAAMNLCEAGDENGALQKLAEAKAILGGA